MVARNRRAIENESDEKKKNRLQNDKERKRVAREGETPQQTQKKASGAV